MYNYYINWCYESDRCSDNNLMVSEASTHRLPIPLMSPCKLGETSRSAVLVCGSSDPIPLATPGGLDTMLGGSHIYTIQGHVLSLYPTVRQSPKSQKMWWPEVVNQYYDPKLRRVHKTYPVRDNCIKPFLGVA